LQAGEFFRWRALITTDIQPIAPGTTLKSQLDLSGSDLNFDKLQVGGRYVLESKLPSFFKPSKSSIEANVGWRFRINPLAWTKRLNNF